MNSNIRRLAAIGALALLASQGCATADNSGGGGVLDGGFDSSFGGKDGGTGATGNGGLGGSGGVGGASGGSGGIAGSSGGGVAGSVAGGGAGGLTGGTGGVLGGGTGGVLGGGTGGITGGTGGTGGAPSGWTCNALYYDDASCDCGCGVIDIDCASASVNECDWCDDLGSCSATDCPGTINPTNNATCSTGGTGGSGGSGGAGGSGGSGGSGGVPTGWACSLSYYGDSDCDCGCGVVDIDCPNATAAVCEYCDLVGSCSAAGCPGTIDPVNNAVCFPVPTSWSCSPSYYGDGDCDCGCGVKDIDCATSSVTDCQYCSLTGSCSTMACPGDIKPTDNAVCN